MVKNKNYTKYIHIVSIIFGIILLFSAFFIKNSWISSGLSKITAIVLGGLAIGLPIIAKRTISSDNEKHANKFFTILEDNKIIKINNFILLALLIIFSGFLSAIIRNEQSYFLIVFIKTLLVAFVLIIIQYSKGLIKILK